MSTEDESKPAQPIHAAQAEQSAHWIWRTLVTGAALTGAANYLIYSRGPGAGWPCSSFC